MELSRTTKIAKMQDGELKEFVISFDELDVGDLLGRGQFGTVKKMHHKPTNLDFAVQVA